MNTGMRKKCVLLLSCGLDSAVNFLLARKEYDVELAITFDYGQKAAHQEITHSRKLCKNLNTPHRVIELPFFKDFTQTSLLSTQLDVPGKKDIDLTSDEKNKTSASKVWVPNRNGIFLNIAAGYAEGLGAKFIVPGFNFEEASTFPDNSQKFQDVLNEAFLFSTENKVEVLCFTQHLMKTEILALGLKNGLSINDLWPCYNGFEKWCLDCESCLRFERAVTENGLTLPRNECL